MSIDSIPQTFSSEVWHYPTLDDMEEDIRRELNDVVSGVYLRDPDMQYLIATNIDEEYLGSVAYKFEKHDGRVTAKLKDIFVREDARNRGVGNGLMDAFEAEAEGTQKNLLVSRENEEAIRFYRRKGYEILSEGGTQEMGKA